MGGILGGSGGRAAFVARRRQRAQLDVRSGPKVASKRVWASSPSRAAASRSAPASSGAPPCSRSALPFLTATSPQVARQDVAPEGGAIHHEVACQALIDIGRFG